MILEEQNYQKKNRSHFFPGLIVGMAVSAVLACGILLGMRLLRATHTQTLSAKGIGSVVNDTTEAKMKAIEEMIYRYYYLDEVDEQTLENGVYAGMVDSLGDKYAQYFTEEELKQQMDDNAGIFYGIGAYISLDKETLMPYFSGIIEGTPAEEAGLRAGDIIYEVDGVSTYQMDTAEVAGMVKGEEGTTVKLTLIRDEESFDIDVVRRKINSPTVSYEVLDGDIGYLQITEFDDVTVDQFTEAYAVLEGSGVKGIILDLRGNPGGLLSAVVDIANQMLPKGLIVYTENKAGERKEYSGDGKREWKMPLVVLINGGSASAAEILTGAIKDYEMGTIIGTTTYGKGIVQNIFSLSDGSAVKMTVSAYYTPKGNNIHGTGIEPDIELEFDAEAYYSENPVDNQLEKAKEVLKAKIAAS